MPVQYSQNRGLTSAEWSIKNPILMANEIGIEIDTNKIKVGDGISNWLTLPYYVFKEAIYFMEDSENNLNQSYGTTLIKNINQDTTLIDELNSGESITLMLNMASEYEVTFPQCKWVSLYGNVVPTLTNNDVIIFWKVLNDLYGSWVGSYDHAIV